MNVIEVSDFVGSLEPFRDLNRDQINEFSKRIKVIYCAEGNVPEIGKNNILLIRTGRISFQDEKFNVIDVLQAGDFYGVDTEDAPQQKKYHLQCVEDSLIYLIARDNFKQFLQLSNSLQEYFQLMNERSLYQRKKPLSLVNTLKIEDIYKQHIISVDPDCTIERAVALMTSLSISSLLIEKDRKLLGILTDKDLRKRVMAEGRKYSTAVSVVMTKDPRTVSVDSLLLNALDIMCRHNIHHLPIMDRDGELVGMVSSTDLINKLQNDPVNLISEIHRQHTVEGLSETAQRIADLVEYIAQIKVPSYMGSQIITSITDALTQRLIEIHINFHGSPPCLFTWVAFGSQARNEQALNADQDNALLIEMEEGVEVAKYFSLMATFVCDGLNACGIPYCKGGIMAMNEDHRHSLSGWKLLFDRLLHSPTPDSVMRASIYFDARCIYGSQKLFNDLHRYILELTRRNELFLYHLADDATKIATPNGFFSKIFFDKRKIKRKGLNLKEGALIPITDLIRVYTLNAGIEEVNSRERLLRLKNKQDSGSFIGDGECDSLLGAYDFLAQLRWDKHYSDMSEQKSPDNTIDLGTLSVFQRQQLKDVFFVIERAQKTLRHRFCRDTW